MKLERADVPVVATDAAPTASLLDKHRLDLAPVPTHALDPATLAPVAATALQHEFGLAVVLARQDRRQASGCPCGTSSFETSPKTAGNVATLFQLSN
jgi:hypothetical protein